MSVSVSMSVPVPVFGCGENKKVSKMPGMSRVYYSSSGSEANEKAFKMVCFCVCARVLCVHAGVCL